MRPITTDPTAGETARAIALDPNLPRPVVDPTDPHHGLVSPRERGRAGEPARIVDPTDPAVGDLAG